MSKAYRDYVDSFPIPDFDWHKEALAELQEEEEEENEESEPALIALENTEEFLTRTHLEEKCAGQYCTIHNKSDHSMRHYPQHWRKDRGIMERVCPHGVGHPDPDDPKAKDSYEATHGCDGCCQRD